VNRKVRSSALFAAGGWLAWTSVALAQVNLPEGFEIVEFGVSPYLTDVPRINNCGQIVFGKALEDHAWVLYLYDNGSIREIARERDGGIPMPDINDHGTVVYTSGKYPDLDRRIKLFDGRKTRRVGRGFAGTINDEGDIAASWYREAPCYPGFNIVLYEDGRRKRLTDNLFSEQEVSNNNRGQVTWTRYDFCQNPWSSEIPLYSNGEITLLPILGMQARFANVSNAGQVVWDTIGGIESWQDGVTTLITDSGGGPRVNDLGDIAFYRWHDDIQATDWWLYRISNGEPSFHRLTEDRHIDALGDINNWTESAWRFFMGPGDDTSGVRFLRRVRTGDTEFDGDVDRIDYRGLAQCMTGPGRVNGLCDCRFLDVDYDGDVDLGDFARFQTAYSGG